MSVPAPLKPAGQALPVCPLCRDAGGALLWQNAALRVVAVDEADYPGFTRVIWHAHVAEMTDLASAQRHAIMDAVYRVERVQRAHLAPDKINLAAFGNVVPHLHWHIIPRWRDDRHFPDPFWAAPRVAPGEESASFQANGKTRQARVATYHQALVEAFNQADTSS